METTIKLKQLRHSAKKLRPVARLFVGKNLSSAIDATMVMSQDSARFLHQALLMAKASAEQKELNVDTAVIKSIMAAEGARIKRVRPNARGRSNAYQKHIAHLVVTIAEGEAKKPKATKKAVTTAKKENS